MTEVSAVSAGIHAYSATTAAMATELAAAAAAAVATGPAMLAPVFGLIGTEFLAAFTGVHSAHAAAVTSLSHTVASIGTASAQSSAEYDLADAATAASLL